jgi:hypothetical protein
VWNWSTTPFIQVTCSGTDAPIRQTVSVDGDDDVVAGAEPPPDEELLLALELQPVIASAAAATPAASTADLFLSPTAGTPSRWGNLAVKLVSDPWHRN